jgi:hypothetical protein
MGDCVSPLPPNPLPKTRIWGGQFAVLIFTEKQVFSKGVGVVLKSRVLQKNFFQIFLKKIVSLA